jgi:hypothetical protein
MRRVFVRWSVLVTVSVAMLGVAVARAQAAAPATPGSVSASLGVTSFATIAVDDTNDHVFISAPAQNEVLVYNFDGTLNTTITGISGAWGMVVNGSTLYVAESGTGDIGAINLSTLAAGTPLATGLTDPHWLVFAGGQLWTDEDLDSDTADQLASVSLAGAVVTFPTTAIAAGVEKDLDLATSPGTPNLLYVAQDGTSPGSIYELNVSSGTPSLVESNASTDQNNIDQLAVSPDGAWVIPAAATTTSDETNFEELSASALTAAGGVSYPAAATPSAVAVSPAGGGIVATGVGSGGNPDISVFTLGTTTATSTGSTASAAGVNDVAAHGLALSADGSRMFAVTAGSSNAHSLWTFNLNSTTTATTVGASPSSLNSGQEVALTATVAPTDGNGTVSFTVNGAAISGCGALPLTNSSGVYTATCTTTSLPSGSDTVTAAYADGLSYSASSGSAQVTVATAFSPAYTWNGGGTTHSWDSGSNWVGGTPPAAPGITGPAGTVGTLTFPNLTSGGCLSGPGDACYEADNDIPGLSVNGLDVNSDTAYTISGNAITIGAGGLTSTSPSGNGDPPIFDLPITVGAAQTWTFGTGRVQFNDAISGNQNVNVSFENGGSLEPLSGMEVGTVTAQGNGIFYLDGDMAVNASDLNPLSLQTGAVLEADRTGNEIGPLTVATTSALSVGAFDEGSGDLTVNGALTLSAGSQLDLAVDTPGTAPGVDYSQVVATGNVNINGASLSVAQNSDSSNRCHDLDPGNTLTLISSSGGTISGTFSNYADGATVDLTQVCNDADQQATGTLSYSSTAVTLTITGAGDEGDVPVELAFPSISGTAEEGQTLVLYPGNWQGATSLTDSWWQCANGNCTQIPGATSTTFIPTSAQLGYTIFAYSTAVGPLGTNTDFADATAAVTTEPLPADTAAPSVSGGSVIGDVLTATAGTWSNSPTSYSYQWERCSSTGSDCAPISNATTTSYTIGNADFGSEIEVQVTATNYGGDSSPASSTPTAVVTASGSTGGQGTGTTPVTTTTPTTTTPVKTTPVTKPVSTTSIKTALTKIGKPAGKNATLKQLLKLNGYMFKFSAPAAGRVTVTWTATIKHKVVILARASMTIASARTVNLKVALTAQGKSDLKRYSTLAVTAKTSFKASGIAQVNQSAHFTLRQPRA